MKRKIPSSTVTVLDNSKTAVQQAFDDLVRALQKMINKANSD